MTPQEWTDAVTVRARRLGPIPRFGSDKWNELPPLDLRRIAAAAALAMCWHAESDPAAVKARLADELSARRDAEERLQAVEWSEIARRARGGTDTPSQAELVVRRTVAPRPGDYTGGPVRWSA